MMFVTLSRFTVYRDNRPNVANLDKQPVTVNMNNVRFMGELKTNVRIVDENGESSILENQSYTFLDMVGGGTYDEEPLMVYETIEEIKELMFEVSVDLEIAKNLRLKYQNNV